MFCTVPIPSKNFPSFSKVQNLENSQDLYRAEYSGVCWYNPVLYEGGERESLPRTKWSETESL
jgi:hypothetical protein